MTSSLEEVSVASRAVLAFRARGKQLDLGRRTAVMGVVNVTPDSFHSGSRQMDPDHAVAAALAMVECGADVIDIGGESTRPAAVPVPGEEELRRITPVLKELRRRTDALISIDTRKSSVAQKALELGADIINDISSLGEDHGTAEAVARAGAGLVLMHMKGTPQTMQQNPTYGDVVVEVRDHLAEGARRAEALGVSAESILLDPGIGFGKTAEHNLRILNRLELLAPLGKPILIGTSRKNFIGKVLGLAPEDRIHGTAASVAAAVLRGAHVVRVHDVAEMTQVVRMIDAIVNEAFRLPTIRSTLEVTE